VHTPIVMSKLERIEKVFYFSSKTEKLTFSRSSSTQTNKQREGAVDPPLLWSFTLCFLIKEDHVFRLIMTRPTHPVEIQTRVKKILFSKHQSGSKKEHRQYYLRPRGRPPRRLPVDPSRALRSAKSACATDSAKFEPIATRK